MKRFLLLALFISAFSFPQNDSIYFDNPAKINIKKLKDVDFKKIKNYKDKFSGVTEYASKGQIGGERFLAKVLVTKDVAVLNLNIIYKGSSWIFIDNVTVKINDKIYELKVPESNRVVSGGVIETTNYVIEEDFYKAIMAMDLKKDKMHVRYSGERVHDFKMSRNELGKVKRMFVFYQKLLQTTK